MTMQGKRTFERSISALTMLFAVSLTGCGNFFVNPSTVTTGTTTTATTGNFAYVVNTTNTLSEYDLSAGKLTAIAGSPLTLTTGLAATSVAVSRANTFVFVGGAGGIECYAINTDGSLTATTAGGATETADFVSLETSPDGQWLFALDGITPTAPILYQFSIDPNTGALALAGSGEIQLPIAGAGVPTPRMVKISPNADYLGVVLGGGGDVFYTFNTTTGILTQSGLLATKGFDDDSLLFDSTSTYAFIGRYGLTASNSTVASYTVSTVGALTSLATVATGDTPYSLALDGTGAFLYSANFGAPSVTGYSLATGALTQLASSPYASGLNVASLARDITGSYLISASQGGSADLTLYAFDVLVPGKLDAVASSTNGSGTAGSLAVATTHSTTESF